MQTTGWRLASASDHVTTANSLTTLPTVERVRLRQSLTIDEYSLAGGATGEFCGHIKLTVRASFYSRLIKSLV